MIFDELLLLLGIVISGMLFVMSLGRTS